MWPLWICLLIGLGIIILFLILRHYSPSTAGMIMSFLKKYGLLIALVIAYLLLYNYLGFFNPGATSEGGDWLSRKANTYLIFGILAFLFYQNFWGNLRYHTPQITCRNGFHGSVAVPPILTKDGFVIFNIGTILWGIQIPWGDRTLVLRRETYSINGQENYLSIARPTRIGINKLTPSTREEIKSSWLLNKDNVYYGYFDDIQKIDFSAEQVQKLKAMKNREEFFGQLFDVDNPKVEVLLRAHTNLCSDYNLLQDYLDQATGSKEEWEEHLKRVAMSRRKMGFERKQQPAGEVQE